MIAFPQAKSFNWIRFCFVCDDKSTGMRLTAVAGDRFVKSI